MPMMYARRRLVPVIGVALAAGILAGCAPGERVRVPDVVGRELNSAFVSVRNAGLLVTVEGRYWIAFNRHATVRRQDPEAGAQVEPGAAVALVASPGPNGRFPAYEQLTVVPDVTAVSLAAASERLAQARLVWDAGRDPAPPLRRSAAPDLLAAYCVATQEPAPGTRVRQTTRSEGGARLHIEPILLSIAPAKRDGSCRP
jgi:beta-lactam-binding protein with PASTA domain